MIGSEAPKQCPVTVTQSVSCMASSVDPKVAVVGGLGLLLLLPVISLDFIWPEIYAIKLSLPKCMHHMKWYP